MFKKIKLIFLLFCLTIAYTSNIAYAVEPAYTQLRSIDRGTFNEFRYKITEVFFTFRNKYDLNWNIDKISAKAILEFAKQGYNYLPDNLINKNHYNHLKTAIDRWILYPNNSSNYIAITVAIEDFLDKTNIQTVKWIVNAFPDTWNAPLTVTLRWSIADPTWTKIPQYNYVWWIYEDWRKKILGNGVSLSHVFREEWKFSIFLDVTSAHKNEKWYTDVLPFSSRADITVKEKIASLIIKVNSINLLNSNEIKFTPDEARYWLLFDTTSSTPTSWAKFIKTSWDFWNGVVRENEWAPRIERVIYSREWNFVVKLTLQTNELKKVEKTFIISIHNPIATINISPDNGFLWDKFTFLAQTTVNNKDLSYNWEIIDLNKDSVIFRKSGTLFTYIFNEKWKYNVKMQVTEPSWEIDTDTKIIYINSRPPVADYTSSIPFKNKPNRVYLDATKSYDPDFSDDWKLKYRWIIDGERVELEDPNFNGSAWYFVFDSIWDHSVVLEVEDPDNIISQKKEKVQIVSILSVDYFVFPRVAQRNTAVRFVTESPEAKFYEWDFWDWKKIWWKEWNISHIFKKSWVYSVNLKVIDTNDIQNTQSKNVYIWDSDSPFSFISVLDSTRNNLTYENWLCWWEWAYILNRVDSVIFSWNESIDITGQTTGLTYSWKVWNEGFKNSSEFNKKFDELWCYPVKLTVKSDNSGKTHSTTTYVSVRNLKPTLSSVSINVVDSNTDPVIVNLSALWAKDRDWIIQSYLWYYYTDTDSEPQDFRATKSSTTSFVLPKVTWNYYFVVVMKDNNEERITSEEITGSKYFLTLAWDNLNTPLIRLDVSNSSVSIWEETTFTANVENILWQDLTWKVKYSWDFDWDWFYDKETSTNIVAYKYISSWEKYAKVKVKYKWFSNTKSITINVWNLLTPEFWYISIWNKFIFFDNSRWKTDTIEWDLWDWTIIKNISTFTHEYTDWNITHLVNLKIAEWTKIKEISKKVVKNIKNVMNSRKQWLVIFSHPNINNKNELVLEQNWESVYIYLWASNWNISTYAIDQDLDYDSDLNGTSDDDEDNSSFDSYRSGSIINVKLNDNKYQKIRLFIKGSDNKITASKDLTIVKNYVEVKIIDLKTLVFTWVTDSVKLKIEKLKELISGLPKENKLKWLMYVQKLQEAWFDNREKTNVILEFEWFIFDTWVKNSDEIINLLESLLVDNQVDKSEKSITFTALKNLIPESILCKDTKTGLSANCYKDLVSKLETIRDNDNVDENRVIWSKILESLVDDKIMTIKQKNDFKAILKSLVYWWISKIPAVEKIDVIKTETEWWKHDLSWLFISILKWLFYIFLLFSWIVLIYFIYYRLVNKDKNIWFQDFIIEKTSWIKNTKMNTNIAWAIDILNDIKEEPKIFQKKEPVQEEKEVVKEEKISEIKPEEIKIEKTKSTDIPDWLKWSFVEGVEKIIPEVKQEEKVVEIIPEVKQEEKIIEKFDEWIPEKQESNIPDWLKWTFDIDDKKSETIEKTEKKSNDNIPDWLKSSFSEKVEEKEASTQPLSWILSPSQEKEATKDVEEITETWIKKVEKKPIKNKEIDEKKWKVVKKTDDIPKQNGSSELWDDWMKVPDWLKTDSDNDDSNGTK